MTRNAECDFMAQYEQILGQLISRSNLNEVLDFLPSLRTQMQTLLHGVLTAALVQEWQQAQKIKKAPVTWDVFGLTIDKRIAGLPQHSYIRFAKFRPEPACGVESNPPTVFVCTNVDG